MVSKAGEIHKIMQIAGAGLVRVASSVHELGEPSQYHPMSPCKRSSKVLRVPLSKSF